MIRWRLENGVYEVELATEPCNEIGSAALDRLEQFLSEADTGRAHALIVYSSIRQGFSAGADLRQLYRELYVLPEERREPDLRAFLDRIHRVMDTLDTLPLVTIGVVHGVCFGGGLELALTCDLLVAEKSARFAFPELRLGLIPGFGGIPRLKRDIGNAIVRDLLLTGRSINAKKAVEIGLASQMVAPGEGLEVARGMAAQAGKFAPEARGVAKAFIKRLPREELAAEKEHFLRLAQSPVLEAALKRFVDSTDLFPYLP
jgi:enoyl-CoA hydratase/carnithine racemase